MAQKSYQVFPCTYKNNRKLDFFAGLKEPKDLQSFDFFPENDRRKHQLTGWGKIFRPYRELCFYKRAVRAMHIWTKSCSLFGPTPDPALFLEFSLYDNRAYCGLFYKNFSVHPSTVLRLCFLFYHVQEPRMCDIRPKLIIAITIFNEL